MTDIRIRDLPAASPAVASDFLAIDNGSTRKVSITDAVNAGRPLASQAEAETGTNPAKAMTPLTTKQSIASEVGATVQGYSANLDELSGVVPGSAGMSILAFSLASDVRSFLDTAPYVATRTALKALDTTKDITAVLTENGREGIFNWKVGDYSTLIAADTQEGLYIKADAVAATSGAWVRVFDGTAIARWFGAVADGVTPCNTAVNGMASVLGYIGFGSGVHVLTTDTLAVPVYFEVGGAITASAGQTVTITSRIDSPRQYIFQGDGSYSLLADGDSGEDSKEVHISWFGGFPSHNDIIDTAPSIAKANAALGNLREGVIRFDNGNYHMASLSTTTINRGVSLQGAGERRTVFRVSVDGVDIFTTAGVAAKFKDIQFEVETSVITVRNTGWYIVGLHEDLEAYNISFQGGRGIYVESNRPRIDNIKANFGASPSVGSSLIHIASGAGARVSNVQCLTSAFGPTNVVKIGGVGTVSGFEVENISSVIPSVTVSIDGSSASVVRGKIDGVIYNGSAGAAPDYVIDLHNNGAFTMSDITIANVVGSSYASNGVRIRNSGSGTLEDISLDLVTISGSSGIGIDIERTAGTLRDIFVGNTVNVVERATPVRRNGTMSNVRIGPQALSNAYPVLVYSISNLPDGEARSIDLGRSFFSGSVEITAGSARHGIFTARAAATPAVSANRITDANTVAVATTLSGTTGTDGNLTLGVQDGVLYVENRLGSSQNITVTVKAP